jgi:hypothetical protein
LLGRSASDIVAALVGKAVEDVQLGLVAGDGAEG